MVVRSLPGTKLALASAPADAQVSCPGTNLQDFFLYSIHPKIKNKNIPPSPLTSFFHFLYYIIVDRFVMEFQNIKRSETIYLQHHYRNDIVLFLVLLERIKGQQLQKQTNLIKQFEVNAFNSASIFDDIPSRGEWHSPS
jgi:hypothetical protein